MLNQYYLKMKSSIIDIPRKKKEADLFGIQKNQT